MKQKDIERLKDICEREGFEISESHGSALFQISKKHKLSNFKGVEFVKCISNHGLYGAMTIGKIYKTSTPNDPREWIELCHVDDGKRNVGIHYNNLITSNESEYFEQLKKESFERFGEIKFGDMFEEPNGNKYKPSLVGRKWFYNKKNDHLKYSDLSVYQSGKWATKLPERVKVEFKDWDYKDGDYYSNSVNFSFNVKNWHDREYAEVGQLIAKQLEKYLNDNQE